MKALLQLGRSFTTAVRALSPAAALGLTLAVIFGGVGVADAASTAFVLGNSNSESGTATLTNSHGTPLALVAPKGTAPFSVSSQAMVSNLNAQFVGGLSAAAAEATGGVGFVRPGSDISLSGDVFSKVASTGELPAGVYYVNATAMIAVNPQDTGAFCQIQESGKESVFDQGGANGLAFVQAFESAAIRLASPASLQEWCITDGSVLGTEAIDAGITAVRVLAFHGMPPQVNGRGILVSRSKS